MADKNRNDSSKIDGFYQFLKHDIDSMKSTLTTEMRLCSSQIGSIYKGIKEDKDASSAALGQEIRYSYKQNQNIYEGLAVLLKKEVAERINSMDEKMSSMAKMDEILNGINDLKDSYNQLQAKYESLSNVVSETILPKLEKIVDKDEMKGIVAEVVTEPKYERIAQEVGAELEKVLIALKANEAAAMAEDAADVVVPSETVSEKVTEFIPEPLNYEEIDTSVKNAMEEVVNADEIAEAVAARIGTAEVDYERLANLVVEKLAAKGISAEVILDDEGIERIADTVVGKVGTIENIDYEKVSLAAQAAQTDPIDYERVAEIVDDKLTKTCDTMEKVVTLDNEGIDKIVDGVANELRNMTLVCEYAPAEDADEESDEEAPVEEVVEAVEETPVAEVVYAEPEQVAIEEVIEETPVVEEVVEETPVEEVVEETPVEEVVEAVEEAPVEEVLDLNDAAVFQAAVAAKLDEVEEREAAEAETKVVEPSVEEIAEESPVEETPVVDEIAVAAEPVYEEDSEGQLVDATTGLVVRLKRSFKAKLMQSEEQIKVYYSDIKNALTSYKKINSNVSWHGDRFNYGRETVAKIGINGKTLCFYLALDPNDPELKQTVYHQKDVSAQKAYENTPFMVKVKSEAASKKALRLVGVLADKLGAEQDYSFEEVDYVAQYAKQSTKQLFEAGEIKATKEKKADFETF